MYQERTATESCEKYCPRVMGFSWFKPTSPAETDRNTRFKLLTSSCEISVNPGPWQVGGSCSVLGDNRLRPPELYTLSLSPSLVVITPVQSGMWPVLLDVLRGSVFACFALCFFAPVPCHCLPWWSRAFNILSMPSFVISLSCPVHAFLRDQPVMSCPCLPWWSACHVLSMPSLVISL